MNRKPGAAGSGIELENRATSAPKTVDAKVEVYSSPSPGQEHEEQAGADFIRFENEVSDGQAGIPRGVYVTGLLQLPIIQQPENNPVYVSTKPGVATQYSSAALHGVTGLLAHNYLAGELFEKLAIGQEVRIIYGNHTVQNYQVTSIHHFKKLISTDLHSDLIDLNSGVKMSSTQVFNQFYRGGEHVTFQTCLKEGGDWSWGLTFVIATPIKY